VLYEMVGGRGPFSGATRSAVLVAILDREPTPLARVNPEVPAELERIVGKALRNDPERRYQVMKDLLLSRDGSRMVFSQQNEASRLWALPLDTVAGRPRVVGECRWLTEEGAVASMPSLSPDGSKLAHDLSSISLFRPGIGVPDSRNRHATSCRRSWKRSLVISALRPSPSTRDGCP
jgi:serine/threonine protein kinase